MIRETVDIAVFDETAVAQEEQTSRIRQIAQMGGKLAGLGALSAIAGVSSLFLTDTSSSLGPHSADVRLTLDGDATFELGVPGSIILPVEEGHGFGADISVGEVPTGASIDDYARSLANIEDDLSDMKSDLAHEAIKNGLLSGLALIGLYHFVGKRRWGEHVEHLQGKWAIAAASGLIAVNLSGAMFLGLSETSGADEIGEPADPIFVGTPLENARLTGYMPELVNDFGKEIIDMWRENDAFYDEVLVNLRTAFEEQNTMSQREGYPIMLFYTDLHCNVGMARVIGEAADLAGAHMSLDGGDTTMGGTSYEKYCIQVLDTELPEIPRLAVGGNHDGPNTEEQQRNNGFQVLDGGVVEVQGLRILGDDDVMRSEFGQPVEQEGAESIEQQSIRLAEAACEDEEGIDIMLVHHAEVAESALNRDCVQTVLSGHVHREEIIRTTRFDGSATFELTGDNASGATNDRPSLGPVDEESPARFYLIKFDEARSRVITYQTVTISADAQVELSSIVFVPLANNE